jgi:uncharacterized protein YeeX (DUF496 family)
MSGLDEYIETIRKENKLKQQIKEAETKLVDAEFILRCIHNESRLIRDYLTKE